MTGVIITGIICLTLIALAAIVHIDKNNKGD